MSHPLLEKAAQHLAQARAIHDEFRGKDMPSEAARQMEQHLNKAGEYRDRVEREGQLVDNEQWLTEPQYKHDMGAAWGYGAKGKGIPGDGHGPTADSKSFVEFVRHGEGALANPSTKADLVQDATGQLIVPTDYAGTIVKDIADQAVIRPRAFVRPTTSNTVDVGEIVMGDPTWGTLETGAVPPDGLDDPPADKDTIKVEDLTCLVKIGRNELDDTDDNLAEIIRAELGRKFGEREDDAFANGDGVSKPTGLAANTGFTVAAAAGETPTIAELRTVPYQLKRGFRKNGVWLASTDATEAIAQLTYDDGRSVLDDPAGPGMSRTLFGWPFEEIDGMPAMDTTVDAGVGTDPSVVFGDVRAAYMIADRRRFTVQRLVEKYAHEGKIGLLFTHRVGGGVIRSNALAAYLL